MPHANWQDRLACQRRWRRENRAKVRAQKRRARIKKKCLSKSLVVVLDDYRKRMSTPVTKTLTVVLEDYRKKKLPTPPPKKKEKIKTKTDYYRRDYYQRNRERIRAQRKECRQRNLEKSRAQEKERTSRRRQNSRGAQRTEYRQHLQGAKKRCVELQKEWRRKNREVINERRRQHRDAITPCDCGLCLTCGGFETEPWSRRIVVPRSDPLEAMERRLDRLEAACSDTSSEVDPRLEEELERVLNETSADEAESESEETDVEDAVSCLNRETTGVTTELRDMERWFQQFDREDEAQPDEYTQTLMVTSNLMNELERFLFS